MPVYANATELAAFMESEDVLDTVGPLLRKASLLVTSACRLDCFDVTPTGIPTDDDLAEAMRDATCAQVERWLAAGVDPFAGGAQTGVVASSSVDGASVSFTAPTIADNTALADTLCDDARRILRNAGLASSAVW
ncbi:hypothetical protein [Gordonia sp. N1V]|uniref:hypothetical protein n=1 Tax=Gordonia sp. N1V TaxID=3034163 RepID=UPI0023E147D7|nr:hypothetical protein [Gordonia sp. N1V]MDF3280482.1 hypothetical protein [Gordonia sp. N1V]